MTNTENFFQVGDRVRNINTDEIGYVRETKDRIVSVKWAGRDGIYPVDYRNLANDRLPQYDY